MRTIPLLGTATAAAAVLLVAGAAPALATGNHEHEVDLHQPTPITADDPEFVGEKCPDIPEGQDGWHFVLPGRHTVFVELRVTFEPGGEQILTTFGPPSDKHAYVASEAGAELVEASATVEGKPVDFRLSHTCPAAEEPEPEPEPTAPEPEPTEEPEPTPTEEPEPTTEPEPSGTPSEGVAGGNETPPAPQPEGEDDTDLADTGSSTPVFAIAGGAALLLGAGGYLALRRRNATTRA